MKRMVGVLLAATLGLLTFPSPVFSQISYGYPPGPTTTTQGVGTTTAPPPTIVALTPVTLPPTVTAPPVVTAVSPMTAATILPFVVAQAPPPLTAVTGGRVALTGVNILRSVLMGLAMLMNGIALITVARGRPARAVDLAG